MSKSTEALDVAAEAVVGRRLEDVLVDALRGLKSTVVFEVADKEYGNGTSFSVTRQFVYDPDCDAEAWLAQARVNADMVKALAFEQMGAEVRRNDQGILERVFVDDVMRAMPGSVVVEEASTPAQAGVGPNPPYFDSKFKDADKATQTQMYRENREWAKHRYASYPQEFEDVRPGKEAGNVPSGAPDFKHKKHWKSGFYVD